MTCQTCGMPAAPHELITGVCHRCNVKDLDLALDTLERVEDELAETKRKLAQAQGTLAAMGES